MSPVERKVVGLDLAVGLSTVTVGLLIATGVGIAAGWWWIGVLAAVGTGVLTAASDRSRPGLWLLVAGGVLAMAFVVWTWYARRVPFGAIPVLLVGLAVGAVANRLVFGVIRDVPPARLQRERSG